VFQHYALFKHMTIRQNIAFGLELRLVPKPRFGNGGRTFRLRLQDFGDRHLSFLVGNATSCPEPWL